MTNNANYPKLRMKNDIMFKYFFSKKGNEKFLQSFLNSLLDEKCEIKEIIHDSHLSQDSKINKFAVLDLEVKLADERIVNIEMQIKNHNNIENRTTFHAAGKIRRAIKIWRRL